MEKGVVYKPLPKSLNIKKSPIDGLGLFATEDIEKGHDFGVSHVVDFRFENGYIRTPLGGFINHSEEPNCKLEISLSESCRTLVSITYIPEGTEITTKYSLYNFKENNNEN